MKSRPAGLIVGEVKFQKDGREEEADGLIISYKIEFTRVRIGASSIYHCTRV
jgi:hypothetical protein